MRPDPGKPHSVPDVSGQPPAGMLRQVRRYELITPLFGGGVLPQHADPVTIVRGSEVRGQLRFWWRACRGGQFGGDLQRMKEAEEKLWGAASGKGKPLPSKVIIALSDIHPGNIVYPFEKYTKEGRTRLRHAKQSGVPAYAAFPLQPDQDELLVETTPLAGVRKNVAFTLTIEFPDNDEDIKGVEAALWAWETFGGIGGRTRRGFGALQRIQGPGEPLPPAEDVRNALVGLLRKHCTPGPWPSDVPHLSASAEMRFADASDPEDAWDYLIKRLHKFRQARDENGYGPSQWPEPDAIRRLTTSRHGYTPSHPIRDKYPRAAFGLPIVFKFRQKDEARRDPQKTILQGQRPQSRLASPLILRPLACAQGQTRCLAAILLGTRLPSKGTILLNAPNNPTVATELDPSSTPPEADSIGVLAGESRILIAFLNTL